MSTLDKERILRHPDLAARLCEPPLNYANPKQWNGYIPPAVYGQQLNTCPRRAALMELATEAFKREQAGQTSPDNQDEQEAHA